MMEARRIVSNTGSLISLEKLHQGYDFIRLLYDTIIIPPGVFDEVAGGQFSTPHAYLQHYGIVDLIEVHAVSRNERFHEAARLHVGEAQAIYLALELALPLLIEETVGRRVAQGMGISISGIAGQVLKAFRQGAITAQEAHNKLRELLQAGRINRKIYEALLAVIP
jgi:predicted nucleic acid-binding protein